jgi:hypothetical protein
LSLPSSSNTVTLAFAVRSHLSMPLTISALSVVLRNAADESATLTATDATQTVLLPGAVKVLTIQVARADRAAKPLFWVEQAQLSIKGNERQLNMQWSVL